MVKVMGFVKSVVSMGGGIFLGILAGIIAGILLGLGIAKMLGVI